MPDFDPAALAALLEKLKPAPVDFPPPQLPQGPNPQIMRDTLDRASQVGLLRGIAGTHTPNWYEVQKGHGTTYGGSPAWDAVQQQTAAPLQMEQQRVDLANQQGAVQNKYATEKARLGNTTNLAEIKGLITASLLGPKLQNAQEVAKIGADAKPKVAMAAPGAQPVSNQTGKPLGPANTGGAGDIDDGIVDREADRFNSTGSVNTPKGLRGAQAASFVTRVMNRAQQKAAASSEAPKPLASAAADYSSDTASQKKLVANADQMNQFEGTARKNLQTFLDAAGKLSETGSPWLNRAVRTWDTKALGSPEQAAFNAARVVVSPEVARVLQTATGSGVLSDSARHEVETILDPNATMQQQAAAAKTILQDFDNRKSSSQAAISEVKGRIAGKPAPVEHGHGTAQERQAGKDSLPRGSAEVPR
jgi:hypothetical protein